MADETLSQRLVEEAADGTLNTTAEPAVPAIPSVLTTEVGTLRKAVAAMKQILDLREGRSGSVMDQNLTLRDLLGAGVVGINLGNGRIVGNVSSDTAVAGSGGSGGGADPGPVGYVDPRPVLTVPPAPTALTVFAAFKNIVLTWSLLDYRNHSYVEIWRAGSNALGTATLIGTSTANIYNDASGLLGATYWYWVRAVNIEGAIGPYNAVSGVSGGLLRIGNTDLGPLVVEAANLANMDFSNLVTNTDGSVQGLSGYSGNMTSGNAPATFPFWAGWYISMTNRDAFYGNLIPVKPGDEFVINVEAVPTGFGPSTTDFRVGFESFDPDGVTVTSFAAVADFPIGSTGHLVSGDKSYTVPAGTGYLRVWFGIDQDPVTGSDIWYFNRVDVRRKPTKLAVNTIVAGDGAIANLAITNALIANAAIDTAKVSTLDAAVITFGTMSGDRIAANSLQATAIVSNSITATQMAANSILAASIAAGAVTATKISVTTLQAISANMGTITAGTLTSGTIFAGALSAATGTFGAVTIATGGSISSGQTAYNTGTGFWLEINAGTPRFSLGNPSGEHMNWDGSHLNITDPTFGPFTASIPGGNIVADQTSTLPFGLPAGPDAYATRSVSVSGGKAPYTYIWMVSNGGDTAGFLSQIWVSSGTTTSSTVSVAGNNDGATNFGRLIVFVTDANGRVTNASVSVSGHHASGTSPGGGGGDSP